MYRPHIKAKELQPGDVFKTNSMVYKEYWVDTIEVTDTVKITTWGKNTFEFAPDKELFLVRSAKMKKEVSNG
ncbi:hypothetical protein [Mongoliibacter ruber]|uniref:Uncharacterized protein n=1 Tax=Mongoliibacter ruber TaxID=1750599 RepID=A0A2T0WV97_9BACT|nr:hypothetical protein [Mongoliibacter ruber]PRY90616.1 hypothetical protein CLW00_101280 [Mongoliibacter ruber]